MTITKKLIIGFGIAVLTAALIGSIGFLSISGQVKAMNVVMDGDIPFISEVNELKIEALMHRRFEKDFLLNIGKPDKQKGYLAKFKKSSARVKEIFTLIEQAAPNYESRESELIASVKTARVGYQKYYDGLKGVAGKVLGDPSITPQEGNKLVKPFKNNIYEFENNVNTLLKVSDEIMKAKAIRSAKTGKSTVALIVTVLILGIAVTSVFGYFITTGQ